MAATVFGVQGADLNLVPTAIKTGSYTAAVSDFVPVDTTSGSVTVTLPGGPADRARIAVKMIAAASSHTVTIAGNGATFNTAGGSTTLTLSLLNQAVLVQYNTALNVWYVQADDLPMSQLDARYLALAGGSLTGDLDISAAGKGLKVAEGSNAKQGTAALVAGSKVVSNASVTANSRILLTSNADGGTPGWLRVSARTAGTSFTITSSSGTDTSTVAYQIFEPG